MSELKKSKSRIAPRRPATLKIIADHLGLSPATVSIVLNNSPVAKSISPATKQRVLDAARKFRYRPNLNARTLRTGLTNTIGILAPELSEGYFTSIMLGVEQCLQQAGMLYFILTHQGQSDLIEEYPDILQGRSVDGLLLINTPLHHELTLPVVGLATHSNLPGVTNVSLAHDRSVLMALRHLQELGHTRIAFMKGQRLSLDSEARWQSVQTIAHQLGIVIDPRLCIYLEQNSWSPDLGYPAVKQLLSRTRDFTAIFCFNDTAAIGAMRAIEDAGLHCPHNISIVGFDDILVSDYLIPRLTTVRQPMLEMGRTAAGILVKRIQNHAAPWPAQVCFEPELIVRESTAPVVAALHSKQRA